MDGTMVYDNYFLQRAARRYLQAAYAEQVDLCISKQLEFIKQYPHFFEQHDYDRIAEPISKEVVLKTLKSFKREKIL